jgi:hypothetical protein
LVDSWSIDFWVDNGQKPVNQQESIFFPVNDKEGMELLEK